MRLDDCYRLLELDPGASLEEVRLAHRDLTKVWHPDRFGQDAPLRLKAEEKLKAINEAYSTICESREGPSHRSDRDEGSGWRVRAGGRELRLQDLESVARLAARGDLGADAELLDPTSRQWIPLSSVPQLRNALSLARARKRRGWAMTLGALALFILLRRPTVGGLLIALILGGVAFLLLRAPSTD